MRLSVIVNNYNYARFVAYAIESALAQTYEETEVVVVDDGSSDGSQDVLAGYADRVTLVLKSNGGQGSAFNAGLAAATGDVVIFLDADDLLHPKTGALAVAAFEADPRLARIQYLLRVVDTAGCPFGATMPADIASLTPVDVERRLASTPDDIYWQPTSGNAFRRTALERIFPMPEPPYRLCADYYLSNLTPYLGTVGALDEAGGDYRIHDGNGEWSQDLRLDRIRANLVRTVETRGHARRLAASLGRGGLPIDSLKVRSVSFSAHRLLSLRLEPAEHPFASDTVARVALAGVASAVRRSDRSAGYRLAAVAWFAVAAIAPRALLPRVARPLVQPPFEVTPGRAKAPVSGGVEPSLDVIVVNYRTPAALRRCLASIPAGQHPQTWVVDNASGDESCDLVSAEFPAVNLIPSEENLLFAGGASLGLARSGAPYALILNADVEVAPETLQELAAVLTQRPECGMVGPRVVGADGGLQPSTFPWPSARDYALAELGLFRLARRLRLDRKGRRSVRLWDQESEREVPWILGCAFAVRRSAFDAVAGFDARFPIYFEEVDLCARLAAAGWSVRYTPATEVRHEGGASTSQSRAEMSRRMYRSMATYHRIHNPSGVTGLRLAVLLTLPALAARALARSVSQEGRRSSRSILPGYGLIALDALRGWPAS